MSGNPQQLRPSVVVCTDDDARRIHKVIVKYGSIRLATKMLGIGDSTFESARANGRMLAKTRTRVLEALAREETK